MFINNINGVIKKNLSLFFFPSDIKFSWNSKQKQQELNKNQLFFISVFFPKIHDIRKSKAPTFEKGMHKIFWGQKNFFFQIRPGACLSYCYHHFLYIEMWLSFAQFSLLRYDRRSFIHTGKCHLKMSSCLRPIAVWKPFEILSFYVEKYTMSHYPKEFSIKIFVLWIFNYMLPES